MMSIVFTITAFILAISILIAVHEFGHFYVARRLGVKVLRYSIGFGKPIWKKTGKRDNTEFVLAAIPLGGYVRMLDEREGEVAEHEVGRAFNRQKVSTRFAIVAAGPVFNFIFALFEYWLVFSIGVTGLKPIVGDVIPGSQADRAGIRSGMEIVAVNEEKTPIWDVALQTMLPAMLDRQQVTLQLRDEAGYSSAFQLNAPNIDGELNSSEMFEFLGFKPWRPKVMPVVEQVLENSPAALAGIQSGDVIKQIDAQPIDDFVDMLQYIEKRPGQSLQLIVERSGQTLTLELVPREVEREGKKVGQIGVSVKGGATYPEHMKVNYQFGVMESISMGIQRTWESSWLTLKMLGKIVVGEVSVSNLSGPINIAIYAGYSASAGLSRFVEFLALVSISLGVLNLLPIPVLDGGHLMYYLIEMIKGSPVSEHTEALMQRIGIMLLFMLISLAFYNDISRLLLN